MKITRPYHLSKRENGIWYLGYEENGKRRWKTTKCRRKAEAVDFLNRSSEPENTPASNLTLSELFTDLSNANRLRASTLGSYSLAVNRLISICGNKELGKYISQDLDKFRQSLLDSGVKPTSVNIWIRSLVAVFSYGLKRGYLLKNPFSLTHTIKIPKQPPVFMTQEEFTTLIGTIPSQMLKDFYSVAGNTGMRLSEILNLKWENVSLGKKQIAVVNTEEFTTKSGKSRTIPMNDKVLQILIRRYAQSHGKEYVFCKPTGHRYDRNYITHRFKKYVRSAKLNDRYHVHTLRHSFASWLALKEVPIFSIQQLLGHASVNTTLQYAHLSSSVLHSAVDKL